jgi:SAM-dependent methyltransferase
MTGFELIYRIARQFDHPLNQYVFRILSRLQHEAYYPLDVLDVGGRRSNYTIGLSSRVSVTDIPRQTQLQHSLDLGTTEENRRKVIARRSNIKDYVIDDMTCTKLLEESYDIAVAVEVLEHVEDDKAFVKNVARLLKPGGVFVMTTPNGDFLPTPYPDHKRHYTLAGLTSLLSCYFSSLDVRYTVNEGRLIQWGRHRPSSREPFRSLVGLIAHFLCDRLEFLGLGGMGPDRKRHLVAVARAAKPVERP